MISIEFSASAALAIILLVLDKMGKLTVPVLVILLLLAMALAIHPAVANDWVKNAPSVPWKYWRASFLISIVILGFSAMGVWLFGNTQKPLLDPTTQAETDIPLPSKTSVVERQPEKKIVEHKKPSISTGPINQGAGSIAQIGGVGNTANVFNGPPPLVITQSQKDLLTESVRPFLTQFSGQKINISIHHANGETGKFGMDLDAAFREAGYATNTGNVDFIGAGLDRGVTIRFGEGRRAIAEAVRDSLLRNGVVGKVYAANGVSNDDFLIIIAP